MSELRQDIATGRWTIVAPRRHGRPRDHARDDAPARPGVLPRRVASCPFCPGNKRETRPTLLSFPTADGRDWRCRVVANGYAALAPGSAEPDSPAIAASGCHEVIIESPRHDHDLADMDADETRAVIETYLARYRQLARDPAIAAILLFRNHGAQAGSSLMHPHAQLMAVGLTPPEIERREAHARGWHERTGENPYLAALAAERRDGRRMVAANGHFMAFVPYAAEAWCEIRIAPVRPVADPTDLWPRETQPLADLLRDCLQRLRRHAGDPAYNLILTASSRDRRGAPWAGWYFRILPRIVPGGGFEMGTGMAILASTPEADAARLRGDVNG